MLVKSINPALANSNSVNTDCATSQEGLDIAVIKLASTLEVPERYWVLDGIQYSYKGDEPVAGRLTVIDGDNIKLDLDIFDIKGYFNLYIPASPGKSLTVILHSGGAGIIGKINTQTHIEG